MCFTGFQAIPMAAVAGRAWWVKRTAMFGGSVAEHDETQAGLEDAMEGEPESEEFEPDAEHFALA